MPAASSPDVDLAFGSRIGLYSIFQVLQAYQLGEREFSHDEFALLAGLQAARLGSIGRPGLVAGARIAGRIVQPGCGQLSHLGVGCSAISDQLARDTRCSFCAWRRAALADGGWAFISGLVLCALAAFCKPIFSLSIYWLNQYFDGIFLLRLGAIIDWLSFQFEYLFGLLIQIFLVLLTFIWIRGLNSEPGRIFEFALKRAVFAAKWAGVVLLATFLLIHLPLLISYSWITQQTDFTNAVIQYIEQTARPLIAVALILFCSIQITLILHNETLRDAVHEHAQLARRHWFRIIWFLVVAGLHLFAISWLTDFIVGAFPKYSVPNLLFSALFTLGRAFLAAWFLASWVCLYRASQTMPKEIRF